MLRAAVCRLERDAAVRERGSNLYDRSTIARQHPSERCERAIDNTQVGDLCHPLDLVGLKLLHGREDRGHCVVDPHVDRTELALGPFGGCFNLVGIGHVGGKHQRTSALRFHVVSSAVEAVLAAREQADIGAESRERPDGRATDASRCARNDDGLFHCPCSEVRWDVAPTMSSRAASCPAVRRTVNRSNASGSNSIPCPAVSDGIPYPSRRCSVRFRSGSICGMYSTNTLFGTAAATVMLSSGATWAATGRFAAAARWHTLIAFVMPPTRATSGCRMSRACRLMASQKAAGL